MTATELIVNWCKFSAFVKESSSNSVILFGESLIKDFDMNEIDKVCLSGGRCADFRTIIQSLNFARYRVAIFMFGGNILRGKYKGNTFRKSLSPQQIIQQLLEISFFLTNRNVAVHVIEIHHRCRQKTLAIRT